MLFAQCKHWRASSLPLAESWPKPVANICDQPGKVIWAAYPSQDDRASCRCVFLVREPEKAVLPTASPALPRYFTYPRSFLDLAIRLSSTKLSTGRCGGQPGDKSDSASLCGIPDRGSGEIEAISACLRHLSNCHFCGPGPFQDCDLGCPLFRGEASLPLGTNHFQRQPGLSFVAWIE